MDEYNYGVFDLPSEEPAFLEFRDRLHVGERPPSFELEDAVTGDPVELASLWRTGPAIIEFGSFT